MRISSDDFEHNSLNRVIFDKYLKRDCSSQEERQLSVKYFLQRCFIIKISPYLDGVRVSSDDFEHNSLNRVIFDKYLKRDCSSQEERQLSVKYFPQCYFMIKISPYLDEVRVSSDDFEHNSLNRVIFDKYLKRDCLSQEERQLSVKYFDEVRKSSDDFEHNSLNRVILDKYLKRDCSRQEERQLSVKYFPQSCFVIKISPY